MRIVREGIATGGKPYVTVSDNRNHRITFLHREDFRRHRANALPRGYRPTLGQPRLTRAQLRQQLTVIPGGK